MKHGDLRSFLSKYEPPLAQKLLWFRDMASGLAYIHSQSVLVADIASRNFLVDSDLSVKFCDFTESTLFPIGTDMDTVDALGYTTQLDVRLLATVFYEVETGKKCDIILYKEDDPLDDRACWPKRQCLPSTEGIWFGSIIELCWIGEIRNADSLVRALDSLALDNMPQHRSGFLSRLYTFFNPSPTVAVFGLLAAATAALAWSKRGR
jgi:serine/threonine protein kinase